MIILWVVLLSVLSGLLYRMGGAGQEGRDAFPWLPEWAFDTKARDIGCALATTGAAALVIGSAPWWAYLLSFLLLFGCLTTYWDFLFQYDNFWFHGFMCGIAMLPLAIVTGAWIGFALRTMALTMVMGVISAVSGKDWVEEGSRGASLPATVLMMIV